MNFKVLLLLVFFSSHASFILPFDIFVSKDGTGNFTTITKALDSISDVRNTRTIIYVKAGVYFEYLQIQKRRITLAGDGIDKTIIRGNHYAQGVGSTFDSATVAVNGDDFIARDITVENTAGPEKGQAVSLRSSSDHSAFYRCSFLGFQDTLYVHSGFQFYRECHIYGTVDMVFGDASVIFQNCTFFARLPLWGQSNVFTAQGRNISNGKTGISIMASRFTAAPELVPRKKFVKTYLGRPWKKFSRTVVMNSYIDDVVDPLGWLEMNGTFALSTLSYKEYMNTGPGSNTTNRVQWPGYGVIRNSTEAEQFTVSMFIQGDDWLPYTDIPYFPGLP